jgi:hypothetical protein
MKPFVRSVIVVVALAMSACDDPASKFPLALEFEKASAAYYGADSSTAEKALVQFVEKVQNNFDSAKKSREGDYRAFVGMSLLRLASIHRLNGNEQKFNQAMDSAIFYFDQSPSFVADPRYQADKVNSLLEMLNKVEIAKKPAWKEDGRTRRS